MIICNSKINLASFNEILDIIFNCIDYRTKSTFTYLNSYICVYKSRNKNLDKILEEFDYIYPDGYGIYLASKILYGKDGIKEYITGTDLYFKLFSELNIRNKKIFIYGGDILSENLMRKKLKEVYPNIILTGYYNRNQKCNDELIEEMNNSLSDILFVGLGTPNQEEFIIRNRDRIDIPVMICVGSGIDFLSGYLKRAPLFMRKLRLEWLFRIFIEPKRLFFRYFFGIPLFIFKIIIQKFKLFLKIQR
ncbi:MAG: WecB/TagA/CpsF family glycosyltransferase [Ignavibacteria bacterium]|nr:WecB/TagA/CpsF family glycosyltransferase [Ignavibacteria bacterium]